MLYRLFAFERILNQAFYFDNKFKPITRFSVKRTFFEISQIN